MNIISKEKKEIRWIGLPTNSAQECQNLEVRRLQTSFLYSFHPNHIDEGQHLLHFSTLAVQLSLYTCK